MQSFFDNYRRWFVLLGLMLVYCATTGIAIHTLPLVYPSLIAEFGWTTAQMTLPATVFYIVGALCSPPAGALLDRFSPRKVMFWGITGVALCLLCLSFVQALWQLVAIFFGIGISLALCGITASMVILTKWFDQERGRATGLLLMSASIGGALFPLVLAFGIESFGWRISILLLAVIALALIIPSLIYLVKDQAMAHQSTEQEQQKNTASNVSSSYAKTQLHAGPRLVTALKNPTFYLIAVATGCVWFSVIALMQHQAIYLAKDLGVEPIIVSRIFSAFFICSFIGKLSFGWLSDYCRKEISMALSVLALIAGIVIIKQVNAGDISLLFIYAIITGIGFGGAFTTVQLLIAQHFAGNSFGKILALLVMIDSIAGASGTHVIAKMRDSAGTYLPAFDTMIVLCAIALPGILIVVMLNPKTRVKGQQGMPNYSPKTTLKKL